MDWSKGKDHFTNSGQSKDVASTLMKITQNKTGNSVEQRYSNNLCYLNNKQEIKVLDNTTQVFGTVCRKATGIT